MKQKPLLGNLGQLDADALMSHSVSVLTETFQMVVMRKYLLK